MKFAVLFAARNKLPKEKIDCQRALIRAAAERQGHSIVTLDPSQTSNGGVETIEEAHAFAKLLRDNDGHIDGVIVAAMNFTEESATMIALRDCKTPILLNAIADEMGKLDYYNNRAAFCGRLALMATLKQFGIAYTAYTPHVCMADSEAFTRNLADFAAVCRVVNGLRNLRLGLIGARPVSFKTVRADELTLQKYGVTTETFDLADVLYRMERMESEAARVEAKKAALRAYADFSAFPEDRFDNYAKWSLAVDDIIGQYRLDAVSLRCWDEPMSLKGIAVCQIVAELNARGIAASCEVDAMNAVAVRALSLATGNPASMVDWNYNYYPDEPNKAIMAHCGNIPPCYMTESMPKVAQHDHKAMALAPTTTWGAANGFIRPMHVTFGSARTADGRIEFYLGEGDFTADPIEGTFYRCGGVIETPKLQENLLSIGKAGFRHHVSFAEGVATETLKEAFGTYLGYDLTLWER